MILSTSNRPKKRLKMTPMPDLTWHDLPIEIKEHIVLAAPKELWPLFRLVCWEWACVIHPHFLKAPSKRGWGAYYTKWAQNSVIRWAFREKNMHLFEWLIVKQAMTPNYYPDRGSSESGKNKTMRSKYYYCEEEAWIKFAVKQNRHKLVEHLMASWGPSMCRGAVVNAIRTGDKKLLKLAIGLGDMEGQCSNLPRMKTSKTNLHAATDYSDMRHAPFFSMNQAMIDYVHPTNCYGSVFFCLESKLKESIKGNPKAAALEIVTSILNQYLKYKGRYSVASQCFAYYGHLESMKLMIHEAIGGSKTIIDSSYIPSGTWDSATSGGHLNVLDWLYTNYREEVRMIEGGYHSSGKIPKKWIRKHNYKVLQWFLDRHLFDISIKHLIWAVKTLPNDPELMPMLSWIMERLPPVKGALANMGKYKLIKASMGTFRSDLMHWLHANGMLELDPPVPYQGFIEEYSVQQAYEYTCYHFLRTLHDLKLCDLRHFEILKTGELFVDLYDVCNHLAPAINLPPRFKFKKDSNHKCFFLASDKGKTNPPFKF